MGQKSTVQEEFRKEGYSREEEYFYKLNRDLIESRRKALDDARARQEEENQEKSHWMHCPKCNGKMDSVKLLEIQVEQCPQCHGVYLDQGELETLLKAREPETFLKRLRKAFAIREEEPKLF